MEDKRIMKTKRSLKTAMVEMLSKEDFEHISITELCRRAEVSRITFYSHYSDKYSLLDEIFDDMIKIGTEDYYRRQEENNPSGRLAAGYVNMLDSILELYYDRFDFFSAHQPGKKSLPGITAVQYHPRYGRNAYAACEKKAPSEIFSEEDRRIRMFWDAGVCQ